MNTHADKTQENKSQSVSNDESQMQRGGESTFQFIDNRPEAVAQRKLQEMANNSTQVKQLRAIQDMANNSVQANVTQFVENGNLVNFMTVSMGTAGSALNHTFTWESSTGSLQDLNHIKTRELVKWDAPPPEFGGKGDYAGAGEHHGLATTPGIAGQGADNHDIVPAQGFPGRDCYKLENDGVSEPWILKQEYQMSIDEGEWTTIPNTNYVLTRWFERKGLDMIGYMSKRGLEDGKMHRAMIFMKDWYK
jgi:hypothetical protein